MWGSNGKARLLVFRSHAATLCSYVTSWKNRSKTTFVPLSKRYTASLLTYRVKRSYRLFISTSANLFISSNNHNLSVRQLTKAAISLISANNFTCSRSHYRTPCYFPMLHCCSADFWLKYPLWRYPAQYIFTFRSIGHEVFILVTKINNLSYHPVFHH